MAMGLARRNAGRTRLRWSNGAVVGPGSGGAALPGLRWPHRDRGLGWCGAIDSFRVEQGNARAGRRLRHARGGASDVASTSADGGPLGRSGSRIGSCRCRGMGPSTPQGRGVRPCRVMRRLGAAPCWQGRSPVRLEARTGLRDACVRLSGPGSQPGSPSDRHMAHRLPHQRAAVRPWVARNGRH